jgi:hypothetical protein
MDRFHGQRKEIEDDALNRRRVGLDSGTMNAIANFQLPILSRGSEDGH